MLDTTINNVCAKIAPLWPLDNFVAVNPFLGFTNQTFADTALIMQQIMHADMLLPLATYLSYFQQGLIQKEDLQHALGPHANLDNFLQQSHAASNTHRVLSLAESVDVCDNKAWHAMIITEISKWCAAYYDQGQAVWSMPGKNTLSLFHAWQDVAVVDRSLEIRGMHGVRTCLKNIGNKAIDVIRFCIDQLQLSGLQIEYYLYRQLASVAGWSGYVQFRDRSHHQAQSPHAELIQLLAIRLAYDFVALQQACDQTKSEQYFKTALDAAINQKSDDSIQQRLIWQEALEYAYRQSLCSALVAKPTQKDADIERSMSLQAVFCIDVRSEVFRRHLEARSKMIETFGFAGFFGLPMAYQAFAKDDAVAQCPVLIEPAFEIHETCLGMSHNKAVQHKEKLRLKEKGLQAWYQFKLSASSCFSYVESMGGIFYLRLLQQVFYLFKKPYNTSYTYIPDVFNTDTTQNKYALPAFLPEDQINAAEAILRNMGIVDHFARLVLLCGHTSETQNNPYAASLNCGACGGHSGESNSRTLALILNHPPIRAALVQRGIVIPDSTWFVAGVHNTTTDTVILYDVHMAPKSHITDLKCLKNWLKQATQACCDERLEKLVPHTTTLTTKEKQQEILIRSHDWSEVRPEWGLADNAAFIIAKRSRSLHVNLKSRVFLHSYDYQQDTDGKILELILTAPMVVANWINLQYYASSVNNQHFGSGTKVLHNVVGRFAIMQGNISDLRVGLPYQSVHNGTQLQHQPLRLQVIIEAPVHMVQQVLNNDANIRNLVNNKWLYMIVLAPEDQTWHVL